MQKIWIALFLVLLGAWVLGIAYHHRVGGSHMMADGMMNGGMIGGGTMGQAPQGKTNQPLPDQQSEGAQLLQRYCTQCHALPAPAAHTARKWPAVVARMKQHMVAQKKTLPDKQQFKVLIDYLQRHAG